MEARDFHEPAFKQVPRNSLHPAPDKFSPVDYPWGGGEANPKLVPTQNRHTLSPNMKPD